MVRILLIRKYKDTDFIVQQIKDFFQYMLIRKGKWYQAYSVIIPRKGKKELNQKEIAHCANLVAQMAEATIDTLINLEDPNYVPGQTEKIIADKVKTAKKIKV